MNICNTGIPGDNTRHLLELLPGQLEKYRPSVTVISAGANDAVNPKMLVPFEETLSNAEKLFRMVRQSGSRALFLTPPRICFAEFSLKYPFCKPMLERGLEEQYARLAEALRQFYREKGIPFLDLYRIFGAVGRVGTEEGSLVRNKANSGAHDGVHPTPAGHALIGSMLFQMIVSLNWDPSVILCTGDSITHGYPLTGMGTTEGDNYTAFLRKLFEDRCGPEENG